MEFILVILVLAAVVWGFVYAWRGSLLVGCIATLLAGYVLSHNFWRLELGPITLTAGRVLIAGLVVVMLWRWRQGLVNFRPLVGADWLAAMFVGYVTFRYLTTSYPDNVPQSVSPFWRLIECFWVPLALYIVARSVEFGEKPWKTLLYALGGIGVFLAVTGIGEVTQQWWAVFPRYIADPELGAHFGRARGPALNSVSLGIFLSVCFWACWFLWSRVNRPVRLALLAAMGLMCVALLFTYTRSSWLALALTLAILPLLHCPRSWRPVLFGGIAIVGLCGAVLMGDKLINMNRQDSNGSASHSVYQRQTFLVVSMRMFADDPLMGCGFQRFFDKKLPYLADRSQQLELESIRHLDHHNTFLSILTETGLIGLSLFVAMLVAWGRTAWQMFRNTNCPGWLRAHGLFALAILMVYVTNGVFHDLSLLPNEQWLLFFAAGTAAGWYGSFRQSVTELHSVPQISAGRQSIRNLGLAGG